MNNNHPFLPIASNNISIEKSNDAVTWLKISMITSNILYLYIFWYLSGISNAHIIIRWRKEELKTTTAYLSVCNEQHNFSKTNMFFQQRIIWRGYKSSRHHSLIAFSLLCRMTSQTFLATEKRALDPAEIEFYSTISGWRPAACNIPL